MLPGPQIAIRPYEVGDAPAVYEAAFESVREAHPFLPWCRPGIRLDEQQAWIHAQAAAFEAQAAYEFAIVSGEGAYLGGCGLNQIDHVNHRANLGYWVRTSATGRGIATVAVRLLVDWAFRHTDLARLEVIISTRNPASIRVAEKAGAAREGLLRMRLLLHGVWHDAVLFSFVRDTNSCR